jgi:hypothetical protein
MKTYATWIERLQQFWNQQVRLRQLYLDRHDVSGRDALDALAGRRWSP